MGKDIFSSFMICVTLCLLYLVLIFPPQCLRIESENISYSMLYSFILTGSIILCVVYTGVTAFFVK